MREGITLLVGGYNEEARAEDFFKSVQMFDEIIYADRSSTDMTREIAAKHGAKVLIVEYLPFERERENYFKNRCLIEKETKNNWSLTLTFADIVHPLLYEKLIEMINQENFNADVVSVPWVEWLFGKEDKFLPYCHYSRPVLMNRRAFSSPSLSIHQQWDFNLLKKVYMEEDKIVAVHHMTFYNLRYSFTDQCIRYGITEATDYIDAGGVIKILKVVWWGIHDNCKKVFSGCKEGKKWRGMLGTSIMLIIYRGVIYYLNTILFLMGKYQERLKMKFVSSFVTGLAKRGEFHRINIIFLLMKLIFFPVKIVLMFLIGIVFEVINVILYMLDFLMLYVVMVWDQSRKIPVELFYKDLKNKILNDEL